MGVVANDEDFPSATTGSLNAPNPDDLFARIEFVFPSPAVKCKENEIVDWRGAVLSRERVVIDFVLGSMNKVWALDVCSPV